MIYIYILYIIIYNVLLQEKNKRTSQGTHTPTFVSILISTHTYNNNNNNNNKMYFNASRRTLTRALATATSSTRSMSSKVGFIGLGNMGGHMAHNLLKAKHEVVVFDVAQSAVDKAVAQGASSAATPRELAAEGCDTIVTMLYLTNNAAMVAVQRWDRTHR